MCWKRFCWKTEWKRAQRTEWLSCRSLIQVSSRPGSQSTSTWFLLFVSSCRERWAGGRGRPCIQKLQLLTVTEVDDQSTFCCFLVSNRSFSGTGRVPSVCNLSFQLWSPLEHPRLSNKGMKNKNGPFCSWPKKTLSHIKTIWRSSAAVKVNLLTVGFTAALRYWVWIFITSTGQILVSAWDPVFLLFLSWARMSGQDVTQAETGQRCHEFKNTSFWDAADVLQSS